MIRYAKRLCGEFLNVEIERLEGDGWVADDVTEGVRTQGRTQDVAIPILNARFQDRWRWARDGEGCLRITIRRTFDLSLRMRVEVDVLA